MQDVMNWGIEMIRRKLREQKLLNKKWKGG